MQELHRHNIIKHRIQNSINKNRNTFNASSKVQNRMIPSRGYSREFTLPAIHTIKLTLEKVHENRMELKVLFLDFQEAVDSIKR